MGGKKPGEKDHEGWRNRLAKALEEHIAEERRMWGDVGADTDLLARYASGLCSDPEKARVEKAMKECPAVRELIELAQEEDGPEGTPPGGESHGPGRRDAKRWADQTRRPVNDPETSR